MSREISLAEIIQSDLFLTTGQTESLIGVFGARCKNKTREALHRFATAIPLVSHYGIYNRVLFDGDTCHYVAGQSYPDEIRTVRKLMTGR